MEKDVLEPEEEELPSKSMFYLTRTAESHSTACCYYGKTKSLRTMFNRFCVCMCTCIACMMNCMYPFYGLGNNSLVLFKGNLHGIAFKYVRQWQASNFATAAMS